MQKNDLINIAECAIAFASKCDYDVRRIELEGVVAFVYYTDVEDVLTPEGVKLYVGHDDEWEVYNYCNAILEKI